MKTIPQVKGIKSLEEISNAIFLNDLFELV